MTTADSAALDRLLLARSVKRGHFVLASGRTSTFYIDCRLTTMAAEGLVLIGQLGLAALREAGWAPRSIGGLTMGADPVAYAIAAASAGRPPILDAFSVRKEAKAHGTGRRVEGNFTAGDAVVVVEDVITTGGSALKAIEAIREEGGTVLGVLAVVDREEGGRATLEAAGHTVVALEPVQRRVEGKAPAQLGRGDPHQAPHMPAETLGRRVVEPVGHVGDGVALALEEQGGVHQPHGGEVALGAGEPGATEAGHERGGGDAELGGELERGGNLGGQADERLEEEPGVWGDVVAEGGKDGALDAGGVAGDAEVEQDRALGLGVVLDVGGLEVPVDDSLAVRRGERPADLLDDVAHQGGGQLPGADGELLERLALDPLHGEVVQVLGLAVGVRLDDVRVVDARAELRLAQEALDGHRVLRQAGAQDLHGGDAGLGVFGLVDGGEVQHLGQGLALIGLRLAAHAAPGTTAGEREGEQGSDGGSGSGHHDLA